MSPIWTTAADAPVYVVTGAGRGLGRACALGLADQGARVIAVARTAPDLESLAAERPGRIEPWVEDVRSDALLLRLSRLERLDGLVNNAGANKPEPLLSVETETLDGLIDLNIRAVFRVAQAAVRIMMPQGHGAIVNVSSQMGHVGAANRTVYCMTKHAVEGFTKALAVELGPHQIRVNSVAPTFVETPMTAPMLANPAFRQDVLARIPLGRLGTLDDVANAVLFLLSPKAALITGTSLLVDGGWTAH